MILRPETRAYPLPKGEKMGAARFPCVALPRGVVSPNTWEGGTPKPVAVDRGAPKSPKPPKPTEDEGADAPKAGVGAGA